MILSGSKTTTAVSRRGGVASDMEVIYKAVRTCIKLFLRRGVRSSYGQFGEDAILQTLLRARNGSYIDVGAFDPILYSNTYALYRRGWSGIVIDPNAALRPLYRIFRRRDTFVCAAIGGTGEGTYFRFKDAAYNTCSAEDAEKRQEERGLTLLSTQPVPFRSLKSIVKEYGITKLDLMNIDVEGMDLAVLRSHDWAVRPRVIAIEDSEFDPDAPARSPAYSFLREKGYRLKGFARLTLVFVSE